MATLIAAIKNRVLFECPCPCIVPVSFHSVCSINVLNILISFNKRPRGGGWKIQEKKKNGKNCLKWPTVSCQVQVPPDPPFSTHLSLAPSLSYACVAFSFVTHTRLDNEFSCKRSSPTFFFFPLFFFLCLLFRLPSSFRFCLFLL